ncbi:MAG TPA: hypothetical protein VH593_19435 [Ktedonobacteraceae bacterium]
MAKFDFSEKQLSIIDTHGHRVDLSLQETVELLQLLLDRVVVQQHLLSQDASQREQVAIHLQQQQFGHLAPVDAVTERAIQLLEAFRMEYMIHPMLEESTGFAQG